MYHTEDGTSNSWLPYSLTDLVPFSGSDLRECDGSLTRSVCDQIFTKSLHWPNATDLLEGATHAIDFSAGGISGIGPLTARNLDGRCVRVIVIGEKGKGDAEFYSVHGVKAESSWVKRWSPSLVKTRSASLIDLHFDFLS
jgi:fatty acid synthase subunit alpha, fungi type